MGKHHKKGRTAPVYRPHVRVGARALRHLAHRGGVQRTSRGFAAEARAALRAHLRALITDAVKYMHFARRSTVTARDVAHALKHNGCGPAQSFRATTARDALCSPYDQLEAEERELRGRPDAGKRCLGPVEKYRVTRTLPRFKSGNKGFRWERLADRGLAACAELPSGQKTIIIEQLNSFRVDRSEFHQYLTSTKKGGWIYQKLEQLENHQELFLYLRYSGKALCGLLLFQKREPSVVCSDYDNFDTTGNLTMMDLHLAMTSAGRKGGASGLFKRAQLDFAGRAWVLTVYQNLEQNAAAQKLVPANCMRRGMAAFQRLGFRHLCKSANYSSSGSGRDDEYLVFHMGLASGITAYEPAMELDLPV